MSGRKGKTQYTGKEIWVNQATGEVREVDTFEKPVGRGNGFMITYLAEIINLIETLGNKKMLVVKYILEHMSKTENTLIITTRELAKKCNVGLNTVVDTLKLLEDAKIIERRTGAIMVSPKLMNNWKAPKEASMMIKYYEFGGDNNDSQIDGQMEIKDLGCKIEYGRMHDDTSNKTMGGSNYCSGRNLPNTSRIREPRVRSAPNWNICDPTHIARRNS